MNQPKRRPCPIAGDSNDAGMSVSLGSYDDPADVQTMIGKAKTSSENCSSFTMTVLSQAVTATVKDLPTTTNAETTIGTVADLKSGEAIREKCHRFGVRRCDYRFRQHLRAQGS